MQLSFPNMHALLLRFAQNSYPEQLYPRHTAAAAQCGIAILIIITDAPLRHKPAARDFTATRLPKCPVLRCRTGHFFALQEDEKLCGFSQPRR